MTTTREEAEAAMLAEFGMAVEAMDTVGSAFRPGSGWETPGSLAVDPNGNLAVRNGAVSTLVDHAFMVMTDEAFLELTRIITPKQNEVQKILHLLTKVSTAEHALNLVNGVKVYAAKGGKKLHCAVYVDSSSPHLTMLARDFASDLLNTDAYAGVHILGAGWRLWADVNNRPAFELSGKDEDGSPFSVVDTGATEYAAHKRAFEAGHVDPFGDLAARISKMFRVPMTTLVPSSVAGAKELMDLLTDDAPPKPRFQGVASGLASGGLTLTGKLTDEQAEEIRQKFMAAGMHRPPAPHIITMDQSPASFHAEVLREAILRGNVYIER